MMRTMMVVATTILAGAMGMTQTNANAQMGSMTKGGPAAGTQGTPTMAAESMLSLFESSCMNALKAMPADKYNFSPASLAIAGSKFDGVRTFADQAKHLAQANYYFASVAGGMKPEADMKAIGGLKTKDEIVAAMAGSFAALHKANAALTLQNSFEVVNFEGEKSTRLMVSTFAVAHGFDHYGQLVEYLRMNGIVPPGSGK
jgi:uncharacterized damage-inducible protein DinB